MASVLFVTPAVPAPARNGLAMRAGVAVDGLAARHRLTVAVVRSPYDSSPLGWVREHAESVVEALCVDDHRSALSWLASERGRAVAQGGIPALARFRPPSIGEEILERTGGEFDALVVLGTCTAGVAVPFLDRGISGILDADDDHAKAGASMAALDPALADEVPLLATFQREVQGWFGRVLFASATDAVPPFVHLPNAIHVPPAPRPRPAAGRLTVVFVGSAGYLPNRDALERLRSSIVPAVEASGVPVTLLHPGLDDDVADAYHRAHLAVVPLRAGGGTRIKLLEAFAHGCPVVSTPTGAQGLTATPGEHLIVTADDDDDEAFAAAVVALARDPERAEQMAAAARTFVAVHHDRRDVGRRLASIVDECVE